MTRVELNEILRRVESEVDFIQEQLDKVKMGMDDLLRAVEDFPDSEEAIMAE